MPLGRRFEDDEAWGGLEVLLRGEVVACSKSELRAGSFGCVRVDSLDGEENPWNWDVRSSYCFCRLGRASEMVREPL